jgi:hypothetical protein
MARAAPRTIQRLALVAPAALFVAIAAAPLALGQSASFRRGDANADGAFNLSDAVALLSYLFQAAPPPPCADAADCDDDGALVLTDPVYALDYLFRQGPPPPAPEPAKCGVDPTRDALGCASFPPCAAVVEAFPPSDGVLALFEFDCTTFDSSGSARHAVLVGGEYVPTRLGTALRVGPANPAGIDWSAHAALLVPPFTIEIVLTPAETTRWRKLFGWDDADDPGWYYFEEGVQSWPNPLVGAHLMLAGELHYLAFVCTPSGALEVYFQGEELEATVPGFASVPPRAIFFRDDTMSERREQIDATVEALRISSRGRTAEEIRAVAERIGVAGSPAAGAAGG